MAENNTAFELISLNRLEEKKILPDQLIEQIRGCLIRNPRYVEEGESLPHIKYNFSLSNTNTDLKDLTKKLKKAWGKHKKPFTMLLYGQSGSGKSYYAKYLAQELGLKYVKKKASDLFSKMVGDTEQNIKEAFREAKEKNAILVIDEADSMLYDRAYARQDFQVSIVNEMLVQMETFEYPFICTTNLIDKIDSASFRRFVFKVKFDYLSKEKVKDCVKFFFNKSFKSMKEFTHVCAGDFYNIKRRLDIICDEKITKKDIETALQEELDLKPDYKLAKEKKVIGFTGE